MRPLIPVFKSGCQAPHSAVELADLVANSELLVLSDGMSFFRETRGLSFRANLYDSSIRAANQIDVFADRDPLLSVALEVQKDSHEEFLTLPDENKRTLISRRRMDSIVEFSPENQIVTVQAGVTIEQLNAELTKYGYCIPFHLPFVKEIESVTIGNAVDFDYPNLLVQQHGSWRDWVLGAQVVLANGSTAKSGAKVVKNVTGYDVHKLIIGSRGTLAVLTEITLRVVPLASIITGETESHLSLKAEMCTYQKTKRSDWNTLVQAVKDQARSYVLDHAGSQAFYAAESTLVAKFEDDFAWNLIQGFINSPSEHEVKLMKKAKHVFDPTAKLNPGEFKFI